MHHFSNAFNMVLTLNFCILKVTDAVAFTFMLLIIINKGQDCRLQIKNFRNVSDLFLQ